MTLIYLAQEQELLSRDVMVQTLVFGAADQQTYIMNPFPRVLEQVIALQHLLNLHSRTDRAGSFLVMQPYRNLPSLVGGSRTFRVGKGNVVVPIREANVGNNCAVQTAVRIKQNVMRVSQFRSLQ
jgi:hypothetical protein